MTTIQADTAASPAELEEAVLFINERVASYVYKGSIEIGNYILEKFFNNDIDLATSKNRYKPVSFLQLCQHPDLAVSYTTLNSMVRVAAQERFLTGGGIQTDLLKYSHKVELIRLENNDEKLGLARACIDESWNIRKLREQIQAVRESLEAGQANAPARQVIRYIGRVNRWIRRAEVPEILDDPEVIAELDPEAKKKLRQQTGRILEDLASMYDALGRLVDLLNQDTPAGDQAEPPGNPEEWG